MKYDSVICQYKFNGKIINELWQNYWYWHVHFYDPKQEVYAVFKIKNMDNIEQKARELIRQFGGNAKYVCLEVIFQLKTLERYWAEDVIDPVARWQKIKEKIQFLEINKTL